MARASALSTANPPHYIAQQESTEFILKDDMTTFLSVDEQMNLHLGHTVLMRRLRHFQSDQKAGL